MLLVEQDRLPCPFLYSPLLQACKTRRMADAQQGLFRHMSGTIQQQWPVHGPCRSQRQQLSGRPWPRYIQRDPHQPGLTLYATLVSRTGDRALGFWQFSAFQG